MKLYKVHYKYTNADIEVYALGVSFPEDIQTKNVYLSKTGRMEIAKWYDSDGPSGLTIDTKTFIWAAFPHDVIYELIRQGRLPPEYRKVADQLLRKMLLEGRPENYLGNGLPALKPMTRFRVWYVYHGLRLGGGPAASPKNKKVIWEF